MPLPQGHRLPRSAHTKVHSRLEEFALLSMRNDSESLDFKSDLHDSINADEWWDNDETPWIQFHENQTQTWALHVNTKPD